MSSSQSSNHVSTTCASTNVAGSECDGNVMARNVDVNKEHESLVEVQRASASGLQHSVGSKLPLQKFKVGKSQREDVGSRVNGREGDDIKGNERERQRLNVSEDTHKPTGIQTQQSEYHHMKDEIDLDPTPNTPRPYSSPSRAPLDRHDGSDEGSRAEIQNIIDQFDAEDTSQDGDTTTMGEEGKDRLKADPHFPQRRSSLEPLAISGPQEDSGSTMQVQKPGQDASIDHQRDSDAAYQEMAPTIRISSLPQSVLLGNNDLNAPQSPQSSRSISKLPPPPAPDPEPDLPFDFHRFLGQLRHRTADPVARFLRSFLIEFGKKQWMAHEQVKIINDFLTFITNKMAQCEVWRGFSDAEFENSKEGMEKLVMNRLYSQTFSPAIPSPAQPPGSRGKQKDFQKLLGPGRRGQHQEDIERDEILGQKVRIYGWVQEEHLDIAPVGDTGRRFLMLAQQGMQNTKSTSSSLKTDLKVELLKIKTYRAPRDKVICVLNCCKVIFGMFIKYPANLVDLTGLQAYCAIQRLLILPLILSCHFSSTSFCMQTLII